jgi:pilus assembly protein TadC
MMEKKNAFRRFISNLIHDNNDINEKTVLGFASFLVLVMALLVDIITGLLGREFPIHEFMFDGFLVMTLGSLGIASVDKYLNLMKGKKEVKKSDNESISEENLDDNEHYVN